jgi:5-methylcytosine-specific restriction endonuclease McrA
MKNTTILNSNYTHLTVVSWQRGLKLLLSEKVFPLDFYTDYDIISTGGETFQVPKTVLLKKYVKLPDRHYRPTRRNVFLRDNYTCAYCLKQLNSEELSVDHILPKSRGGKETWSNLITACKNCNCKKGDMTPEEAGMPLLLREK